MKTSHLPRINAAIANEEQAGNRVIDSFKLPCGGALFRLSNFNILRADKYGVSHGRTPGICWESAKKAVYPEPKYDLPVAR